MQHRGKDVHLFTGFIQKKTFFIGKTNEISGTLHLMHGGILIKSSPK
jgi:hypothetical protein